MSLFKRFKVGFRLIKHLNVIFPFPKSQITGATQKPPHNSGFVAMVNMQFFRQIVLMGTTYCAPKLMVFQHLLMVFYRESVFGLQMPSAFLLRRSLLSCPRLRFFLGKPAKPSPPHRPFIQGFTSLWGGGVFSALLRITRDAGACTPILTHLMPVKRFQRLNLSAPTALFLCGVFGWGGKFQGDLTWLGQIFDRIIENIRTIRESPNSKITTITQQSSNFIRSVAMVNTQNTIIRRIVANKALPSLTCRHFIKLFESQSVANLKHRLAVLKRGGILFNVLSVHCFFTTLTMGQPAGFKAAGGGKVCQRFYFLTSSARLCYDRIGHVANTPIISYLARAVRGVQDLCQSAFILPHRRLYA